MKSLTLLMTLAAAMPAAAPAALTLEPVELRGFLDGVMEAQRKAHRFAGAVVVVVKDGALIFSKGYGYSDFAERRPVDAERTLFRIASNSKMFVWTAVMQLVEEGKLDLRADVNLYLKGVEVPPAFGQPVTLEHLMTHTAGFEEKLIGLFRRTPDAMRPLTELMRRDMPERVFPPGKVTAYSNYGTTLAALIVEQVSGVPYERYLEERILRPLGMRQATLSQPLKKELAADMSKGYRWAGSRLEEKPFEYVPWGPCGGMSASGGAMARFLMAHLNDGALGEARILKPETARRMRTALIGFTPALPGLLHGFLSMDSNEQTVFGHGGDTVWFHSLSMMLPESRLGVFIAYNTDSGSAARDQFSVSFLDHYFPQPLPKEPPAAAAASSLQRFTGTYAPSRASLHDATKMMRLLGAATMKVDADGYLAMTRRGASTRWRQIAPLVFAEVDGPKRLYFKENERGDVAQACASPLCVVAALKQPWWNGRAFQYTWAGVSLAVLLLGLIAFPIAAVVQRGKARPPASKIARATAWLACLLTLSAAGLFAAKAEPSEIVFGIPDALAYALGLWVVAAALSAVLVGLTIRAWESGWWRWTGRVSFTLVTASLVAAMFWLHHWNLLGWRY